ncbi:MAG: MMPL family transporter [Immundisolibacteraceae bacterium]|nr:MMPL family transporter [Immundisolibacteraceae bacterium]
MSTDNNQGILARISSFLADWQIKYRWPLLLLFVAITGVLGYQASFLRMDPGFDKSIPVNHDYMKVYHEFSPVFGGANVVIISMMVKDGDIFTEEFMDALAAATQDTLFIRGVDRSSVTSIFSPQVNFVAVDEDGFVGYRVVKPDFANTPEDREEIYRNLLQSDEMGRLVTNDYKGALIRAELVEVDPTTGEALNYSDVAAALDEIRDKYQNDNVSVHVIGFSKFIDLVIDAALGVVWFFVIALAITAVMLYFYSSSMQITFLAILVAVTAVVWQLGLVHTMGYGIDPLSILVPFLIMSIGVSHAIQMTNAWKLEMMNGATNKQAARESFNKLFIPGATALLTLAVGFAVISLIDIQILFELAITASIGTGVMILTNKFMLPGLLSFARMSPAKIEKLRAGVSNDRPFWRFLSTFADRKRGSYVLVVALIALVFGVWKGNDLIIGDSEAGAPEFWPDALYNQDINSIISNFNIGIDEVTVIVDMAKDGCVNHAIMETADHFVWEMSNVPGVQAIKSLSTIVKVRTVGNNEGHPKFFAMPRDQYSLSSALRNMELNQKVFNDKCDAIPVRLFLSDHKADTLQRVTDAVKTFEAENGRDEVHFRLASGSAGVMAAINEAVTDAEMTMLIALFTATGILTYLTFFSFRGALCVLIPLGLVSYLGNAVMVLMGIGLKVSTLPVVALGVGVGVDYGIYLFSRMQSALREGKELKEAYYYALTSSGTAVVFTASTMSIGVATWYFSELKFQADMGLLLAYMFFVNMVAAIFVLPALAAWIVNVDAERASTAGVSH